MRQAVVSRFLIIKTCYAAGILWLGNVQFDAGPDESVMVRTDQALNNAAALLECDPSDLAKVLSSKVINAGGETIITGLKMDAALDTRYT